jgi:hypothetical protein
VKELEESHAKLVLQNDIETTWKVFQQLSEPFDQRSIEIKRKLQDLKHNVSSIVSINSYLAVNKIPPLDLIISPSAA